MQLISNIQEPKAEIKTVCDFLENNYMKNITLNDLSDLIGLSKYYLLRSFTKQKGISPYSYLETIRIGKAKNFLEQGIAPIDVALQTGFTDQSHFTNFFKKLIGLTPKQYMNIFIDGCRRTENDEKKTTAGHLSAVITILIWGTTFVSLKYY